MCSFGCSIRGVRLDARRARRSHGPPHDDRRSDRRACASPIRSCRPTAHGRLRAHDDRREDRPAERRHLGRAGRRVGDGEGAHRRRQDREHAALVARRQAARVHLHARRRDPQVYVADADGSSVTKDHRASPRACSRRSSSRPTAPAIAFVSDVYPECPDEACNKRRKRRGREESGQGAPPHAAALSRHWDEWRENVRHHVFVADRRRRKRVVDLTPGDFDSPPGQQEDGAIAFSPDGTRDRVRVEPRRERSRGVDDEQRRVARAGDRRSRRRS